MVISHTLTQPLAQIRWRKLALSNKNILIRLIAPRRWISRWLSKEVIYEEQNTSDGNFEIRTVDVTNQSNSYHYLIRGFRRAIKEFDPDVIYCIGVNFALIQTIIARRIWSPRSLLVFFTQGVPANRPRFKAINLRYPQNFIIEWLLWWFVLKGTDAGICHYPELEERLRRLGYRKPVFIQTQIGVNEDIYYPDPSDRAQLRASLRLEGFTVGFTGRITEIKGIFDIAAAFKQLPSDAHFLVVGDGPDYARLEELAKKEGWADRLHLTGYVSPYDVPKYMRAMDCFVLGSRTTKDWEDTFPNAVAQAMVTGLPVVGSSCGAIPFLLGGLGLVFREGDVDNLLVYLKSLYEDPDLSASMGAALRERGLKEFSTQGINESFCQIMQTLSGNNRESEQR